MRDTDAAGLIYFAEQLRIAHETFEAYLDFIGVGFASMLRGTPYIIPIVHTESDYHAPLFVGDRVTIQLQVERIGTTSFTLRFSLQREDGAHVGTVRTVHVSIDRQTRKKIPLPDAIKQMLTTLEPDSAPE
jgi:1,4-dihydroxy-2-naphthoyl-CoA hydrolase